MTIKHALHKSDDEQIIIDRNYEKDTVTITLDYYGTRLTMTVGASELSELMEAAGI